MECSYALMFGRRAEALTLRDATLRLTLRVTRR